MEVFLVLGVLLAVLVGVFANSRGRSGIGWGLLSLIISPLITFIIVLCLSDLVKEEQKREEQRRYEREERRRHEETIAALMKNK